MSRFSHFGHSRAGRQLWFLLWQRIFISNLETFVKSKAFVSAVGPYQISRLHAETLLFFPFSVPFWNVCPITASPGSAPERADAQDTLGKRSPPSMTSDHIDRIIEQKYFYAGASARWMFATQFERLMEIIQWNLDRSPNFETGFQGLCGLRCAETNYLVTVFTDASLSSRSKNRNFVI